VLRLVASRRIVLIASPPLFLEYEEVLKRPEQRLVHGLAPEQLDEFLAELAALSQRFCVSGRTLWGSGTPASRDFAKGETMSRAAYPLKLPHSVKKAAARLAKEDGVSLNQWIAVAVAEKVGVVETAAEFFKKRAGKAKGRGLMKFLRNAPVVPPEPHDEVR
jgi:hypothetical protein